MKWIIVILGALLVLPFLGTDTENGISREITPPGQPSSGPGGSDYLYTEVIETAYGNGVEKYWIFEPKDHTEQELPVIVFLHGWLGMHPRNQVRWIEHLVKKGNIVIFPKYQMSTTLGKYFIPNAIAAIKDAFERLRDKRPAFPYRILQMLPYILTIVSLISVARRATYPAALLKPYRREE
jgi:acetyl esterase/lipase